MDLHWVLSLALAFGLWGFWKRRVTLSQLAALMMGWAIEWSKKHDEDILEMVQRHQPSPSENTKLLLQQELFFAAVSAARTTCEAKVKAALGPDGLQAFEAALPVAVRAFLKEGTPEGEIRARLAQLEAAYAEYHAVIFAPEIPSMEDLAGRLYTVFSERVFGKVVEDFYLATAFFTNYMACDRGFAEGLKPLRIVRG